MSNFEYLLKIPAYEKFAFICVKAESQAKIKPVESIELCVKALNLVMHWVYETDNKLNKISMLSSKINILSNSCNFISEVVLKNVIARDIAEKIEFIQDTKEKIIYRDPSTVKEEEAIKCLEYLFDFIQWIETTYGINDEPKKFKQDLVEKDVLWSDISIDDVSSTLKKWFK